MDLYHTPQDTRNRLADVSETIRTLISWADADAKHARARRAWGIAEDDRERANELKLALYHVGLAVR